MLLGSLMQIIIVNDNYTVNINERANLLYVYVTLNHKTSHKCQYYLAAMQLFENLESEGAKKSK